MYPASRPSFETLISRLFCGGSAPSRSPTVTSYREGTAGCCTLPKCIPSLPKRLLIMMANLPSSAISYENPPRRMRSYTHRRGCSQLRRLCISGTNAIRHSLAAAAVVIDTDSGGGDRHSAAAIFFCHCRDAAETDRTGRATLTRSRRVAKPRQCPLQKRRSGPHLYCLVLDKVG